MEWLVCEFGHYLWFWPHERVERWYRCWPSFGTKMQIPEFVYLASNRNYCEIIHTAKVSPVLYLYLYCMVGAWPMQGWWIYDTLSLGPTFQRELLTFHPLISAAWATIQWAQSKLQFVNNLELHDMIISWQKMNCTMLMMTAWMRGGGMLDWVKINFLSPHHSPTHVLLQINFMLTCLQNCDVMWKQWFHNS